MVKRVVLLVLGLAAGMAQAARLDVGPADGPLQAAIDRARAGDELQLAPGTYRGRVVIDKPLTLTGGPGVELDAGGEGDAIRVRAPGVTIRQLGVRAWGVDLTAMNAGIFVERTAASVRISDNHLKGGGFGIWLERVEGARVVGNRIEGDPTLRSQDRGNGIHLFNVRDAEVVGNTVSRTRDGIYIDTSNHNLLRDNTLRDLRYGIHYMYSHHNRVEGNRTTRTRTGYALMQSRSLTVVGNRSEADENYGILMNGIVYSEIRGNRVSGVRQGHNPGGGAAIDGAEGKAVFIYNSQFNQLTDNRFADSDIGIHLTAGSEDNAVHGNAFVQNRVQVKYVATRPQDWSHEGRGNYWSDYLGWDRNSDGVGDIAYEPNDGVDQLLWRYPTAKLLMHSPAVQTLRWAQQAFPVFRPQGIRDSAPLIRPPEGSR